MTNRLKGALNVFVEGMVCMVTLGQCSVFGGELNFHRRRLARRRVVVAAAIDIIHLASSDALITC